MIPVTFLMHPQEEACTAVLKGKEMRRPRSDYTDISEGKKGNMKCKNKSKDSIGSGSGSGSGSACVSMFIGGHCVGRRKPLHWTDDFEGFELTPQSPSQSPSSSTDIATPLSLHSLGMSGGRMLCVTASSDRGSHDSQVLTGPVCLFRGDGVGGVNGMVAEAICRSLKYCRLSANIRDASKSNPLSRNGLDRNSKAVGDIETSVVIAEIIAFMLLIQAEVRTTFMLKVAGG